MTTLVGGGTGPAHGTRATTCTPAPEHMRLMLQATDQFPLNIGFTGKVATTFSIQFASPVCKYLLLLDKCLDSPHIRAMYSSTVVREHKRVNELFNI